MTKPNQGSKKLKLQDIANCLDVLCKANAAIVSSNPQLSTEILIAIETLMMAYHTKEKENSLKAHQKLESSCTKFTKIEEDTITDLVTGEILYKGTR